MENSMIKKLLFIAVLGTGIGGLIFLCLSFMGGGDWTLPAALGSIGVSNLLNVFRVNFKK